jgi:hypothetical protein
VDVSTLGTTMGTSRLSVRQIIAPFSALTNADGFYHYFNEWDLGPLHTWFQYQVKTKCTTYLLFDCPQEVKEKLLARDFLPQPLIVDLLLAEANAQWREQLTDKHYQAIFNWVRALISNSDIDN